jgi:hypothetical protein
MQIGIKQGCWGGNDVPMLDAGALFLWISLRLFMVEAASMLELHLRTDFDFCQRLHQDLNRETNQLLR